MLASSSFVETLYCLYLLKQDPEARAGLLSAVLRLGSGSAVQLVRV